jgi:HNH endonuclease
VSGHRAEIMPLSSFPAEHQERIANLVAQPDPPEKWLSLGLGRIISRAWFEWHWARGRNPMSSRRPLPTRLRELVIMRDGYVCGLCGGDVDPKDVHLDHRLPWSKGGQHTLDNLQVAHSRCNIRKGARVD